MQETSSFWTEIKALEDRLAKAPDSICFARLSEVYLKMGLADDALHVARRGVSRHPRYLSGQRALAHACQAKGFDEEALAALLVVTESLPEDVQAQKFLGRLLVQAGNHGAAVQAFKFALEFAPDDVECRLELDSIAQLASDVTAHVSDDDIIDDLEILEELDVLDDEDDTASEAQGLEVSSAPASVTVQNHDPLSTSTLAELYVSQGFVSKALDIYRSMLVENPGDQVAVARITELEEVEFPAQAVGCDVEHDELDFNDGADQTFYDEAISPLDISASLVAHVEGFDLAKESLEVPVTTVSRIPSEGIADNALTTLGGWLENIRRIRSCH